jgi:hypothetical protein
MTFGEIVGGLLGVLTIYVSGNVVNKFAITKASAETAPIVVKDAA